MNNLFCSFRRELLWAFRTWQFVFKGIALSFVLSILSPIFKVWCDSSPQTMPKVGSRCRLELNHWSIWVMDNLLLMLLRRRWCISYVQLTETIIFWQLLAVVVTLFWTWLWVRRFLISIALLLVFRQHILDLRENLHKLSASIPIGRSGLLLLRLMRMWLSSRLIRTLLDLANNIDLMRLVHKEARV